jgi:hypothetical protein
MAIAGNVHDRAFYEQKFFDWMSEHNGTLFLINSDRDFTSIVLQRHQTSLVIYSLQFNPSLINS